MVDKFVSSLNSTLHDQMDALAASIKDIIAWQKTVKDETTELVEAVVEGARQQETSLEYSRELLEQIGGHVTAFQSLEGSLAEPQSRVNESIESFSRVSSSLVELHKSSERYLQKIREQEAQLQQAQKEQLDVLQGQLSEMQVFWDRVTRELAELQEQLLAGVQLFSEQLRQDLQYTFGQFDKLLAEATQRLRVVVSSMSESVADLPDEMERIGTALQELQSVVDNAVRSIAVSDEEAFAADGTVVMEERDRWSENGRAAYTQWVLLLDVR